VFQSIDGEIPPWFIFYSNFCFLFYLFYFSFSFRQASLSLAFFSHLLQIKSIKTTLKLHTALLVILAPFGGRLFF